jgi:3-oxoadipate enol-lactonase
MAVHQLGPGDALHVEHRPPAGEGGLTFVFVNALTGDAASWEATVAAPLRGHGHGSLLWNFRGQKDSPFSDPAAITAEGIVADARALLDAERPARPVYVGLSIGGLFALQLHLGGAPAIGLLLINTLRKPRPRLEWINAATHRAALTGGPRLIQDLMLPHLMGPAWLAANRNAFLGEAPYEGLPPDSGTARLLAAGMGAEWDVDYERVSVPVMVLSGLRDRVFYDAADVAELAVRMPKAERVDLPDFGHLIPMERPQAVVDACLALAARIA